MKHFSACNNTVSDNYTCATMQTGNRKPAYDLNDDTQKLNNNVIISLIRNRSKILANNDGVRSFTVSQMATIEQQFSIKITLFIGFENKYPERLHYLWKVIMKIMKKLVE